MMSEPPRKKQKKPSQSDICGIFSEKIKWYNDHPPSRKWQGFKRIKINYTYITKNWEYSSAVCSGKFLVPFGMMKTIIGLRCPAKCYHSYNVLPVGLCNALNLTAQQYQLGNIVLQLSHERSKGVQELYYAYCNICQA